jgi:hypothetical protein
MSSRWGALGRWIDLPGVGLANLEDPAARRLDVASADLSRHALRRLVERLLSQIESAPVNAEERTVMAVAGRLETQRILTIDRRDLSRVRPRHCESD